MLIIIFIGILLVFLLLLLLLPGQAAAARFDISAALGRRSAECCRDVPLRADQQHPRDGLGHALHDDAVRDRPASRRAAGLRRASSARRRELQPRPRSARSGAHNARPEPEQEPERAAQPRSQSRTRQSLSVPREIFPGDQTEIFPATGDLSTDQQSAERWQEQKQDAQSAY